MDRFTGVKTATSEELPERSRSWIPSTSSASPGTRWTSADAASSWPSTATGATRTTRSCPRRTLPTGAGLLADKQKDRLVALFAAYEHVEVDAT